MLFWALKQPFPVPADDGILSHLLLLLCWVFPEGLHPQSDVTVYSSLTLTFSPVQLLSSTVM